MPYVPHTPEDVREMLAAIGAGSLEELFRSIPEAVRLRRPLDLPAARSETEILRDMERLAGRNARVDDRPSFLGAGVYHRFIPAAVDYL
ncbi:MAG: glycine dehydrogenase, partial [Thermoanaerobaculia bacterium]